MSIYIVSGDASVMSDLHSYLFDNGYLNDIELTVVHLKNVYSFPSHTILEWSIIAHYDLPEIDISLIKLKFTVDITRLRGLKLWKVIIGKVVQNFQKKLARSWHSLQYTLIPKNRR